MYLLLVQSYIHCDRHRSIHLLRLSQHSHNQAFSYIVSFFAINLAKLRRFYDCLMNIHQMLLNHSLPSIYIQMHTNSIVFWLAIARLFFYHFYYNFRIWWFKLREMQIIADRLYSPYPHFMFINKPQRKWPMIILP